VTALETVRRVANQFDLSGAVVSVRPFGSGHINETFLVTTPTNDYVVQRINGSVFRDPALLVANVHVVSTHLLGAFVPELVGNRSGEWLVQHGDDAWRCWHRVFGAEPIAAPTPARVHSAANLLGEFHAGLSNLPPDCVGEVLPDFHAPARRLRLLRAVVSEDPMGRVAGVQSEIEAAFAAAPLSGIADDLVARVPRRVAHNDAKLDNVLFRGDNAVCLVDLDTVMPSAWFWDVGDLLRTGSTAAAEDEPATDRAVVDPELYLTILTGYRGGLAAGASPTSAEAEALEHAGAIVTYEQALRFLTDWIAGDVYYRTTRPAQNRDRAAAQLELLASMPGTVGS
jgi:Ser/Thr protein kinase RdoA (MazF antagonist)